MSNGYFTFKQFTVGQDRCAMKVGTDGVLLGAWAAAETARRILDVGTGTGLLALMLAQRNPLAKIDALEIEEEAACQARENVARSPWPDRIRVYREAFQQFVKKFSARELAPYDHIVCNPPYFVDALPSPDARRTSARHAGLLPYGELVSGVGSLLDETGCFSAIFPCPEAQLFIDLAQASGLYLRRSMHICPTPGKEPRRILVEFSRQTGEMSTRRLVIEEDGRHGYSAAYRELTKDFYLKF